MLQENGYRSYEEALCSTIDYVVVITVKSDRINTMMVYHQMMLRDSLCDFVGEETGFRLLEIGKLSPDCHKPYLAWQ